jgi:hypothetical protein
MILSVKDEAQQEYESEVKADACGTAEFAFCDAIEAVCRSLKRVKNRISSHHNALRINHEADRACEPLTSDIIRMIGESYAPDFAACVAEADTEDRILDHEFIVEDVRKHYEGFVKFHAEAKADANAS